MSVCSAAQHNDMFTSSQIPIKIPEVGDKDSVCVWVPDEIQQCLGVVLPFVFVYFNTGMALISGDN